MLPQKPIDMFIFQPLYLEKGGKKEYVKSINVKFPFCRIEPGDVFTGEKRARDYYKMRPEAESKVVAVRYNYSGHGCCVVLLEERTFKNKEELNRYVSGKGCV